MRQAGAKSPDVAATVDYVFDGDTFSARVNLENGAATTVRVRIRNIDAPEIHGECEYETNLADMAKRRLAEIIPKGTDVALSKIKDDKYLGRIDALVGLDGSDVGDIMVKEKLARKYNGGKRASWCDKK
jgi:endonuclease YncB( thermonuclease family)